MKLKKPPHHFNAAACIWQGMEDSNLRMLESKSSALTNLANPLQIRRYVFYTVTTKKTWLLRFYFNVFLYFLLHYFLLLQPFC